MDSIRGALNSFTGGQNNNQGQSQGQSQGHNQYQGQGQDQFRPQDESAQQQHQQQPQSSSGGGGFLSGLTNKFNTAAGGGRESEKNEDMLDKGVDFVQERFLGQGPQDNESAVEQAKDEQISDFIRKQYKSTTGSDFPVKDKETRFG